MTALARFYPQARPSGAALRGIAPLCAYKSQAESLTNSATLQNDDALILQLQAGATYAFRCVLGYTAGPSGTSDIAVFFTAPTGAAMNYSLYGNVSGSATNGYWETLANVARSLNSAGTSTPLACIMEGSITMSTAPGALQLQWSQHTASTTYATTVLAGSALLAWRTA